MVSTGLCCATGFVSSILLVGRLTGFRRVTEEYGCKLRKGLFADGLVLGVVDTLRACFFLLLLLCVIHGFVSVIDYTLYLVWPALAIGCLCIDIVRRGCRSIYTVSFYGVDGRVMLLAGFGASLLKYRCHTDFWREYRT